MSSPCRTEGARGLGHEVSGRAHGPKGDRILRSCTTLGARERGEWAPAFTMALAAGRRCHSRRRRARGRQVLEPLAALGSPVPGRGLRAQHRAALLPLAEAGSGPALGPDDRHRIVAAGRGDSPEVPGHLQPPPLLSAEPPMARPRRAPASDQLLRAPRPPPVPLRSGGGLHLRVRAGPRGRSIPGHGVVDRVCLLRFHDGALQPLDVRGHRCVAAGDPRLRRACRPDRAALVGSPRGSGPRRRAPGRRSTVRDVQRVRREWAGARARRPPRFPVPGSRGRSRSTVVSWPGATFPTGPR
jgi:hypothetical protein